MLSKNAPLVVSYGGGINSTAMVLGLLERGHKPDLILFADTGAERPATYRFVATFDHYLREIAGIGITIVRYQVTRPGSPKWESLEHECLERATLPSLAYGWHKCSEKWKVKPQVKALAVWREEQQLGADVVIQKAIGFRVGEERRRKEHIQDPGTRKVFPLQEWGWDQSECLAAIQRAGLPSPPKSACFFCPATTKAQVRQLAQDEPQLFRRAVTIERKAIASGQLQTVVGLGRHWTWEQVAATTGPEDSASDETPCGCYDGQEDD